MMACGRLREREHVSYYVLIETRFSMSSGVGATGSSSFRLVLHGSDHRCRRLLTKSLLDSPHVRISQTGEELVWAGEGQDVVPDLITRSIPFNKEPLLARSGVIGERTVSKTEPPDRPQFIHDVDDPAGVQRPHAEDPSENRHHSLFLERRVGCVKFRPAGLELLPPPEVCFCSLESDLAFAQPDSNVGRVVAGGEFAGRGTDPGRS
jgi:hypothetical protein